MLNKTLICAAAFAALMPSLAFADGDGALTGAAGGAVTGAVVGGPVGAVVGAGAGAVIGGAATGPDRQRVIVEHPVPVQPCASRTTETTDSNGNSSVTRSMNCPN